MMGLHIHLAWPVPGSLGGGKKAERCVLMLVPSQNDPRGGAGFGRLLPSTPGTSPPLINP